MLRTLLAATVTCTVTLYGWHALAQDPDAKVTASMQSMLNPYTGPYGGVPPFDKIQPAAFKPAFLKAMDEQRREFAAITANKESPTYLNTILALENSGRAFTHVKKLYEVYTYAMKDQPMQAVEQEMAPILAAYDDEIVQNDALFARVKAVYDARDKISPAVQYFQYHQPTVGPNQHRRLTEVKYRNFVRKGAALGAKEKVRLKEINQRLAELSSTFSQNLLADEQSYTVVLDKEGDLAGLPDTLRASLRTAAEGKGQKGKWLIKNTRSSAEPFLTFSSRRDLREKVWKMWVGRGDNAGPKDNKPIISQILALRGERAKLLGFPSHAHWKLDDNMAKTPEAAMDLMLKVWKAAILRVREEVTDMQQIADAEKAGYKIAAWDYRYFAEKVRKAKYDFDQNEVTPYLQLDKMRDAMFWAASQLYGLKWKLAQSVPVYHTDMTVYEVIDTRNAISGCCFLGLWYFDPYTRDGKMGGAWMHDYQVRESLSSTATIVKPLVSNNANFVKGKPGEPVLISWNDAVTLFHEFGHALHGLLSMVWYPTLTATNTPNDFIEFPSRLYEEWLTTPEILNGFALHYQTGKPIPANLVAKIQKAKKFNKGFDKVEELMSAIYDLKIHTAPTASPIDPDEFEKRVMQEIGAPAEIVMRHRPTQFSHIFADLGYDAGYYSYLWAETLAADTAEVFQTRGYYDSNTASKLSKDIMSVGYAIPPEEAFRNFRGRDVDTTALMRKLGFPIPK
jgi:peptidyl-dipeptidase Dcp